MAAKRRSAGAEETKPAVGASSVSHAARSVPTDQPEGLDRATERVLRYLDEFERDRVPFYEDIEKLCDWSLALAKRDRLYVVAIQQVNTAGWPDDLPTQRPPRRTPEKQAADPHFRAERAADRLHILWKERGVEVPGSFRNTGSWPESIREMIGVQSATGGLPGPKPDPLIRMYFYRAEALEAAAESALAKNALLDMSKRGGTRASRASAVGRDQADLAYVERCLKHLSAIESPHPGRECLARARALRKDLGAVLAIPTFSMSEIPTQHPDAGRLARLEAEHLPLLPPACEHNHGRGGPVSNAVRCPYACHRCLVEARRGLEYIAATFVGQAREHFLAPELQAARLASARMQEEASRRSAETSMQRLRERAERMFREGRTARSKAEPNVEVKTESLVDREPERTPWEPASEASHQDDFRKVGAPEKPAARVVLKLWRSIPKWAMNVGEVEQGDTLTPNQHRLLCRLADAKGARVPSTEMAKERTNIARPDRMVGRLPEKVREQVGSSCGHEGGLWLKCEVEWQD